MEKTETEKTADKRNRDLADALLAMPEVVEKLDLLLQERKLQTDALTIISDLELNVKILVDKADMSMKQTMEIRDYMVRRLKALDSLEARWSLLIERVAASLDELNRVLKNM